MGKLFAPSEVDPVPASAGLRQPKGVARSVAPRTSRLVLLRAVLTRVEALDMEELSRLASELGVEIACVSPALPPTGRARVEEEVSVPAASMAGPDVMVAASGSSSAILPDAGWAPSELLGSSRMAQRLRISRATLDNWRIAGKVVALRKGLRNFLYPTGQFDRLRPVVGLDRVVPRFRDMEEAWTWLNSPCEILGGSVPLDRLKAGHHAEVEGAVPSVEDDSPRRRRTREPGLAEA